MLARASTKSACLHRPARQLVSLPHLWFAQTRTTKHAQPTLRPTPLHVPASTECAASTPKHLTATFSLRDLVIHALLTCHHRAQATTLARRMLQPTRLPAQTTRLGAKQIKARATFKHRKTTKPCSAKCRTNDTTCSFLTLRTLRFGIKATCIKPYTFLPELCSSVCTEPAVLAFVVLRRFGGMVKYKVLDGLESMVEHVGLACFTHRELPCMLQGFGNTRQVAPPLCRRLRSPIVECAKLGNWLSAFRRKLKSLQAGPRRWVWWPTW